MESTQHLWMVILLIIEYFIDKIIYIVLLKFILYKSILKNCIILIYKK